VFGSSEFLETIPADSLLWQGIFLRILDYSVMRLLSKAIRFPACSNSRVLLFRTVTSNSLARPIFRQLSTQSTSEDHVSAEEKSELVTKESLPWYLQVDTITKPPEFLLERQRLPEIPEDAPQMLQPLMQQLSVDLGLDYLTLLDLRKLDPPAALGTNLLMIIGTARSEKHLHTSADRFCRWLRSTYKLRPNADGLLGRDERKLKMKRKAKRAKLLGNGMDDNGDDGIRTGWVCVDVGIVERTAEDEKPLGFVGFGQRSEGVKVVVQMLTEEKRAEIDLESLWNGILRRVEKEQDEDIPQITSNEH